MTKEVTSLDKSLIDISKQVSSVDEKMDGLKKELMVLLEKGLSDLKGDLKKQSQDISEAVDKTVAL